MRSDPEQALSGPATCAWRAPLRGAAQDVRGAAGTPGAPRATPALLRREPLLSSLSIKRLTLEFYSQFLKTSHVFQNLISAVISFFSSHPVHKIEGQGRTSVPCSRKKTVLRIKALISGVR